MTISLDHLHEVAVKAIRSKRPDLSAVASWELVMGPATFLLLEPVLRAAVELQRQIGRDETEDADLVEKLYNAVIESGLVAR